MSEPQQLVFSFYQKKEGKVIIPRPEAWRTSIYRLAQLYLDNSGTPRPAPAAVRWLKLVCTNSPLSYEPGICKRCRAFVWCYDGEPPFCRGCGAKDCIFSFTELYPYY